MAQRVTVEMVDDLDGTASDAVATVTFALDGVQYEIDLAEQNADRLREALGEFVSAAHRIGGRAQKGTARRNPRAASQTREQNQAIRDWARENGWPMSERGRIPADVIAAYENAQADAASTTNGKTKKARRKEPAFSG